MAHSLANFSARARLEALLQNSIDGGARVTTVYQGLDKSLTFTDGTSSSQFDILWSDNNRTLADEATEDIDLYDFGSIDIGGGAGKDALGQTIALADVVGLLIVVESASTGGLIVGGNNTAAAWNSPFNGSDSAKIGPFGPNSICYLISAADPAFAVADTSNHLLRLEATGGAVTYSIAVAGRSA